MALLFVDGFGQFQGQTGSQLLASLTGAGYLVSQKVALAEGRHPGSYALELQVSGGAAGTSWSRRDNGVRFHLRGVAFGLDRWVVVGDNGVIYSSTDTITWTPCVNPIALNLKGVAYGDGMWVAVGGDGKASDPVILTSEDGLNWTRRDTPYNDVELAAVAYGNGRWIAVGRRGANGGVIFTSTDGVTWGVLIGAYDLPNNTVLYHEDIGWLIAGNQGMVQLSSNGTTWEMGDYGATGNISSVAYDGTMLVAAAGPAFRKSHDGGRNWVPAGQLSNTTISALAVSDGTWVAVGSRATIYTSADAENWVRRQSPASSTIVYTAVAVSSGPNVAWVAVGTATGSGVNTMSTIIVSMAPPTTISRTFHSAAQRVVLGFAHKATARGRIASIEGVCDIDWPAGIEILGQTGNGIPIRNAWYYYELTIDKTAKKIHLHINNTADLSVDLPPEAEGLTEYKVTWQVENGAVGHLSDIYWLDNDSTSGSTLNGRLGPIRVPIRFPTEDVLTEWEATVEGPHWSIVGVAPPDAGKHIYSSQSGATELFKSSTPLPEGAGSEDMPIIAVGMVALATKSDLDRRQLGFVVGEGPDQLEVVETEMSIDPKWSYGVFEKAPGGGDWTAEEVEAAPFGVVVRP